MRQNTSGRQACNDNLEREFSVIIRKWPGEADGNYTQNTSAGMASDLSGIRTGSRLTVGLQCYLKPLRFLRVTVFAEFNILYK